MIDPLPPDDALTARLEQFRTSALSKLTILEDGELPPAEREDISAKLRDAGFPERHIRKLAEGLHGPGLQKAAELLPRLLAGDALLFLLGDRGPGKTQIATWWASQRKQSGKSAGRYIKCADLIGEIKATWHDGGKRIGTEQDVLQKYRKAKYLVIDEFHERGGSEWESRCLVNLLDHRYDDMLATVLIANMTEAQAVKEINPSILSRANQTGGMVICDWPSYRNQ